MASAQRLTGQPQRAAAPRVCKNPFKCSATAAIRAQIEELDSPALDRAMTEELFGISRRSAIRLMASLGKPEPGKAMLIRRTRLLAMLDDLLATRPVRGEIARKRELREKLAALEREAQPRTTTITSVPPDPANAWPAGVTLDAPGALTLRFSSPEELLGAVLALAEDAAGNYEAFLARLGQRPGQGRGGALITVAIARDLGPFDGPLELLLALVRRNQYPLDALPIAEITRQYLTYIKDAREADVEVGGDFLETASWLVLLKSRALLPQAPDARSPAQELERALLDHATLHRTAGLLRSRLDAAGLGPGSGMSPVATRLTMRMQLPLGVNWRP